MEHFVIESQIVEANHQVGALQFGDKIVYLLFAINPVVASRRVVGDADAHPHAADLVPSADFVRRLLSFQIKIDKVFHCGASRRHAGLYCIGRVA